MSATQTTPPIGPYSRPHTLAKMDQRTKEARLMRETRAELTAHVGGKPSATQRALIEQAVQLRLRIATMDRRFATSIEMTQHDSRTYLAWSNSYSRLLRQLGLKATAERPPTLAEILAQPYTPPASPRHTAPAAVDGAEDTHETEAAVAPADAAQAA
jgi:hypothetical protein